jgi:hypothetical protein
LEAAAVGAAGFSTIILGTFLLYKCIIAKDGAGAAPPSPNSPDIDVIEPLDPNVPADDSAITLN